MSVLFLTAVAHMRCQSACAAHAPSFMHIGERSLPQFQVRKKFFVFFLRILSIFVLLSLQSTSFLNVCAFFDRSRQGDVQRGSAVDALTFIYIGRGRWLDSRWVKFLYSFFFLFINLPLISIAIHKFPKCFYCF